MNVSFKLFDKVNASEMPYENFGVVQKILDMEKNTKVLVKKVQYIVDDDEFNDVISDFRGQILYSSMITKLCNYDYRSNFIVNVIDYELKENENQQIMVLSQNKSLIYYLLERLNDKKMDVGLYLGGMKEAELKKSESKKIILATYSMASEGLDIKTLTTLIMATPKSDICQSVGRILRQKHEHPLVIDIVDKHQIFKNQYKKRETYYKKQNFDIVTLNNSNYFTQNTGDKQNIKSFLTNKTINNKEEKTNNIETTSNRCLIDISSL